MKLLGIYTSSSFLADRELSLEYQDGLIKKKVEVSLHWCDRIVLSFFSFSDQAQFNWVKKNLKRLLAFSKEVSLIYAEDVKEKERREKEALLKCSDSLLGAMAHNFNAPPWRTQPPPPILTKSSSCHDDV